MTQRPTDSYPQSLIPHPSFVVTREITGNTLRSLLGLDKLKSTLFTVRRETTGEFVITGRGYGHGRGMCQTGAMALAAKGFEYRAILNRYYAGAISAQIVYNESASAHTKFPQAVSGLSRRKTTP